MPARRVVSLLGVERLFHVKHMFMGLVSVSVAASGSEVSHDSMTQKWAYMSYEGVSMT